MVVPTFKPKRKSSIFIYVLAFVGVGLLVYFGGSFLGKAGGLIGGKSGLVVEAQNSDAEVSLDDNYLGKTPFESKDIKSGEHKVTVKNASSSYDVQLTFARGSQVAMVRDLGVSNAFSSGQNLWLEKSSSTAGLSVVSEPSGAKGLIDNTQLGSTPFSTDTLSEGEYDLKIEAAGFEAQTSRIKIQKGHKLNVVVNLFPIPSPSRVELLADSTNLYDVNSAESAVTSNSTDWAKAVVYWNKTRGLALGDTGINKEPVFDYFIDFNGRIYDKDGNDVTSSPDKLGSAARGAYLRRVSDGPGLTEAAKTVLTTVNSALGKRVQVSGTPAGWLNVRATPSTTAEILQRVNEGETYAVLEEQTDWVKIKILDTVQGWVSSSYTKAVE